MHPILSLVLGLILAGIGGEFFVKGLVQLAAWARMPASLVGATVAAFATSSPELTVAVNSALGGVPEIALGDALGSNVVNVGLVLGVVLAIGSLPASADGGVRRDLPWNVAVPILTFLLIMDGTLSRIDAIIMLIAFAAWLVVSVRSCTKNRTNESHSVDSRFALAFTVVGLVALVACGSFIVEGAKWVGSQLGLSTFVTGATLVALGTSMPELATAVISRIRGHDDVGVGTILGSNLFNGLFIVAVAALIRPITVSPTEVALSLITGLLLVLLCIPRRERLSRRRGYAMLGCYAVFVGVIASGLVRLTS